MWICASRFARLMLPGLALALMAHPIVKLQAQEDSAQRSGATTPEDMETQAKEEAVVVLTNQKYNHNCFWAGPKGLNYGRLPNAQPIQKPALYPDQFSTYFVAQFEAPSSDDWYLEISGEFPHERYFSFTVANQEGKGQLGGGDFLRDDQIAPDAGSVNPFRWTERRDATPRNYKVKVVPGLRPEGRKRNDNTLYAGQPGSKVHLAIRNYVYDRGYDGTGNAKVKEVHKDGLPQVTLFMDGQTYTGDEVCTTLNTSDKPEAAGLTPDEWLELVAFSGDPVNAPALPTPEWALFWDTTYSTVGSFIANPVAREAIYPATDDGGEANNPDTKYLSTALSLSYGDVIVTQGKMPTFPPTKDGEATWPTRPTQLRYWSACTGGAPPSGAGWDCVYDEMVPLHGDRRYTLVVSRREDRPRYATKECGVTWLNFGPGEDIPPEKGGFTGARPWVSYIYMRYMHSNKTWQESPARVPMPTAENPYPQEAYVMKDYFPISYYETTAQFDSHGCLYEQKQR